MSTKTDLALVVNREQVRDLLVFNVLHCVNLHGLNASIRADSSVFEESVVTHAFGSVGTDLVDDQGVFFEDAFKKFSPFFVRRSSRNSAWLKVFVFMC